MKSIQKKRKLYLALTIFNFVVFVIALFILILSIINNRDWIRIALFAVLCILSIVCGMYHLSNYFTKNEYTLVLNQIKKENILTVANLSKANNFEETKVREIIQYLIENNLLDEYIFQEDTLTKTTVKNGYFHEEQK